MKLEFRETISMSTSSVGYAVEELLLWAILLSCSIEVLSRNCSVFRTVWSFLAERYWNVFYNVLAGVINAVSHRV